MLQRIRQRKRGFTIIELLIVIAIIAILAAVAIPALLRAQKSGKESAALQVLKSLRNAEEVHKTRSTDKTYGDLAALKADGSSPLNDAGVDVNSGYSFTCDVSDPTEGYTIVAIPPKDDMLTYTLVDTGEITQGTGSGTGGTGGTQ